MAKAIRICAAPGCDNPYYCRGYCRKHHFRWRKYGDPLAGATFHGDTHDYFENVALPYKGDDCLIWPYGRTRGGYGAMRVDGKHKTVSRAVCERVHGPAPSPEHEAAHNCGKGHLGCVNPKHIVWKTPLANQKDRLVHGTDHRGEKNKTAKLTRDDVLTIRRLGREGVSQVDLALRFGLRSGSINNIIAGRSWKWLPDG